MKAALLIAGSTRDPNVACLVHQSGAHQEVISIGTK